MRKTVGGAPHDFDVDEDRDGIPEVDRIVYARRVLLRYAQGVSIDVIAFEDSVSHWTVEAVIREAAREVREENRQFMESAFLQQDLGIQHLIRRCMESVERHAAAEPPLLDRDSVRILITLYERRSKLLGLDKSLGDGSYRSADWMRTATQEELCRRAGTLGIRLPASIATAPAVPEA